MKSLCSSTFFNSVVITISRSSCSIARCTTPNTAAIIRCSGRGGHGNKTIPKNFLAQSSTASSSIHLPSQIRTDRRMQQNVKQKIFVAHARLSLNRNDFRSGETNGRSQSTIACLPFSNEGVDFSQQQITVLDVSPTG